MPIDSGQETKSTTSTEDKAIDTQGSETIVYVETSTKSDKQFDEGKGSGKPVRRNFRAKITND